jgi:putative Holliday junction resolvase
VDNKPTTIIGLDVGAVRVGVSVARLDVRIPQPLTTLENGVDIFDRIIDLAHRSEADEIIVGWPRGMDGQQTQQTRDTEQFADTLRQQSGLNVRLQDEALTSQKAEAELQSRRKPYTKADVDALAATYILEDYLHV